MFDTNFIILFTTFLVGSIVNCFLFHIKHKGSINYHFAVTFSASLFLIINFIDPDLLFPLSLLVLPFIYKQTSKSSINNTLLLLSLLTIAFSTSLNQNPLNGIIATFLITLVNFIIHSKIIFPHSQKTMILTLDDTRWHNIHKDTDLQVQLENMLPGHLVTFEVLNINQAQDTVTIKATYAK